jgi:hypothetical protein
MCNTFWLLPVIVMFSNFLISLPSLVPVVCYAVASFMILVPGPLFPQLVFGATSLGVSHQVSHIVPVFNFRNRFFRFKFEFISRQFDNLVSQYS